VNIAEGERQISTMAEAQCDGAVISQQGIFYLLRDELSSAALTTRLPTMAPSEAFVPNGILVAYSAVTKDRFADLVGYIVRVLRGEKRATFPCNILRSSNWLST
jgi:ABC-type uncharacterized transport system substrate-binding protein